LVLDVFGVEILRVAKREHPVNKRKRSKEFRPSTDHDEPRRGVSFLEYLEKSREDNVLAQSA
jgi:hypothetical protein